MSDNAVPMTFGLVSKETKKKDRLLTYKVFPSGSRGGWAVRTTSLNSLRKKLVKENPVGEYDVYRLYDAIGVYRNKNGNPEWWIKGGTRARWWDIDPKTGKIGVDNGTGIWYYVNEKGEPESGRRL